MRTPGAEPRERPGQADSPGVGAAAKQVADHARNLVGLELELAGLELKRKAGALGLGAGLAIAAGVVGLYAFGFLLLTAAAGLAEAMPLWLALLIVSVALLLIAGVLGLVGMKKIQRGTPPVPEQAVAEAKRTTEALRGNGSQ
jgi:hypothetical protein